MSRLRRDYDESIFQESNNEKIDDFKECGNGCGSKDGKSITFGTESAKKSKKRDVVDDVEECGDGCGTKVGFGKESADTTANDTAGDMDDGDPGSSDIDTTTEAATPKKSKKQDTDLEFDDDEECEDGECDDDDDADEFDKDIDEKPKKKSKKKKSKKTDTDVDLDDDADDDFNMDDSDSDKDECDDEKCDDGECDDDECDEKPKKKSKKKGVSDDDSDEDVDFDEEGFLDFFKRKKKADVSDPELAKMKQQREDAARKLQSSSNMSGADKAARIREARLALTQEEVSSSYSPKPGMAEHDDTVKEYALESYLNQISEDQLKTERQIMTSMIDDLYKEYMLSDFYGDDVVVESDEETIEDGEEVVQERFFGGTGKTAAGLVKPVAKGAKRILDFKNGVPRKGIIRNVVHRTSKDLKKGGVLYKLVAWPFLVIKNLVQTLYHKTKSFIAYKGLLIGIEVKINREIAKIRKRARNMPKMALAGGAGYATAALASIAKGEPLPLKPTDFIASEGAKLVEELGRDTMLRALTSRLADAIEESPEKIRAAIQQGKDKVGKVTPEMGKNAKPVLTMNQNKITMEGLVNMNGISKMMDDIDDWADIAEGVALGVRSGDESCVSGYLSKIKQMEETYMPDGKLNLGIIFNAKSGAVKIADFYEELASKLTEKTKKLEKGLEKITGLENAVKEGNISIASDTEKGLAELNTSVQHTCNAFVEMIDSIDDLGKYVMNTMETYLGCLEQTESALANGKGRDDGEMTSNHDEPEFKPKKKRHKLFGKKDLEEDDVDA